MTLDKLAGMVAKGFESIEQRMATKDDLKVIEFKVDNLDRKIDKVDLRVDQVYEILDRGEKDFLGLQKRVQVLERVNKAQS